MFRLLHLQRKVDSQKEGQLSFLKTNIGTVMEQIDTLMGLREKYEQDVVEFSNEPTVKLEKAIKGCINFYFRHSLEINLLHFHIFMT